MEHPVEDKKKEIAGKYGINSAEWWEKYFSMGLGDYFLGGEQTRFFAELAYNNLEKEVVREIDAGGFSICDMGCAQGEGTAFFKEKFPQSEVTGIDISQSAIEKARQNFPGCEFRTPHAGEEQERFDVVYSSNVLEHLENPTAELQRLADLSAKYLILMTPVNDETGEESHINKFSESFFASNCLKGAELKSLRVIDTSRIPGTCWPGEQAIAVYKRWNMEGRPGREELVAKPETWDNVAETYSTELEDGDYRLADDIERILLNNGLQPGDSLIEMGCGSGHLSACLAKKGYKVTLLDFSTVAVEKAKATFDRYGLEGSFVLGDLFHLDESAKEYDFAWNSGVMEHFGDAEIITLLGNIGRVARKGVLYLVPNSNSISYLLMRARLMADDEWIYGEEYLRRDYEIILKKLGYKNVRKSYISTPSISAYQMWKAEKEQGKISELYKALVTEKMLPEAEGYLAAYFASNQDAEELPEEYEGSTVQETRVFDLVAKKIGYGELKARTEELQNTVGEMSGEIERLKEALAQNNGAMEQLLQEKGQLLDEKRELEENIRSVIEKSSKEKKALEGEVEYLLQGVDEIQAELDRLEGMVTSESMKEGKLKESAALRCAMERINSIDMAVSKGAQTISALNALIKQKDEGIAQAQELCWHFANGKLMKLNHFLFRLKGQYIKGSKEDRKAFRQWLKGRFKKTNRSLNEGEKYNPWMVINSKLNEVKSWQPCLRALQAGQRKDILPEDGGLPLVSGRLAEILKKEYSKYDVIILSVIDYNFRHQRPQHFADRFAANSHRVFYVNANFIREDSIKEESENLFVVDFGSKEHNAIYTVNGSGSLQWMKEKLSGLLFSQGIRDAVVVVDYPNWVVAAEFMRDQYGFKIVTDYMDDYTGFLNTSEDFLKENCIKLLKASDMVVASSEFLSQVALEYVEGERISIIRNGTEVEHFYKAFHMDCGKRERKVVGYYGAVAHWFAWEKVCFLAEHLPMCDIVIIGEVTEHGDKLKKYSNIKLLGEKKYTELPEHLAYFDVCLIPFDTSTDLIKATNPVKFYEYLSAGKKIVATEIPELMPYRDKYVYMSNDNDQFLEYVTMCFEGRDVLADAEECIDFARENDWQKRFESFSNACVSKIPSVSIIILTYNNLKLNKICIDSVLKTTAYPNYELIIVDNHSTDGTVEYLKDLERRGYPQIKVVYNEENMGFAGGNNIGIRQTNSKYVMLLNNDTVVTRGWLTNLTKHLENDGKYGMCGAVTNSIGNEAMIKSKYRNMKEMREFAFSYTTRHMGEEYLDVDRLAMFGTLIRRDIMEEHGELDEQYKIGMFEDDDYAQTVMAAGYKLVLAEDSFIHHVNNASFQKFDDETYRKIFEENKTIFERKWKKKWRMPSYREGVTWDSNRSCALEELEEE